MNYVAPSWLPGGNLQTIWPVLYSRRVLGPAPHYRRERWTTPDADFIDVDWLLAPPSRTLLVIFHGLEGSSGSHYALAFAMPHFRGCSGELNKGPRAYHSGHHPGGEHFVGWQCAPALGRRNGRTGYARGGCRGERVVTD